VGSPSPEGAQLAVKGGGFLLASVLLNILLLLFMFLLATYPSG
jgi:hypothetical protein